MNLLFVFLQAGAEEIIILPDYDGSHFRYYVFLHDSSSE